MLKATDIVKNEGISLAGGQGIQSALNVYAVNNAGLRQIPGAKVASNMFFREVRHKLVE